MSRENGKPSVILLVEDDAGDQEIARRALAEGQLRSQLQVVEDGEAALDYLYHRGKYLDPALSPRPDLILMDLNLPKLNGKQVLEKLRSDPALRRLPVVFLTTSQEEDDVVESYDLGVNSYIAKPVDLANLMKIIQTLETYWFQIVVLPSR